jgi:two-component system phosphate regulon sensor histidine kinase PhoR
VPRGFAGRVLLAFILAAAACAVALIAGEVSSPVAAIALALLALSLVAALAAIQTVSRSARVMGGAAREIASGQLAVRIDTAEDELGQAAADFNRMAARIEQLVEAASQERNRLMAAINSSVDAIVAVDAENNVAFANDAVADLLEVAPGDMIGRPFVWAVPAPDVIEALRTSREQGVQSSQVVERPRRKFLRAIVTPIRGGGAWSSLVVFHDLTDARRLDQVRRDFVANVSHELRTPLAAIKSVIETLEGGAMEDEAIAREFLGRADGEVDRLVLMVEELLELSRIESGEQALSREPVDIGAAIATAVDRLRPQAQRAGVDLGFVPLDDPSTVIGDRGSLERAVVNLVHNAIKFTPPGGAVNVTLGRSGEELEIAVADSGAGIEPQDLPRVFERFFKADRARQAGGTGLGLALVKHTVEAHGGRVAAESERGRGSTFRIWLPAAVSAAANAAGSAVGESK